MRLLSLRRFFAVTPKKSLMTSLMTPFVCDTVYSARGETPFRNPFVCKTMYALQRSEYDMAHEYD